MSENHKHHHQEKHQLENHHHGHHHHDHGKMEGHGTKWEQTNPNYASLDSAPQTFFYTISNMLKLDQAKNILEVGCGAGKLLSTILDLKNPEASYYATDLSEAMVEQSKKRLEAHFAKYESKLSFNEFLEKQHLHFSAQNGENIKIQNSPLFDRIISNMVLCHANDPQKMLKNWHSITTQDCLLGVSLLGNPQKNELVRGRREAIIEAGQKLPEGNPPYYWYDKISKIVESTGWEIILQWDQNSLFPFLDMNDPHFKGFISKNVSGKAEQIFMKKVTQFMNEKKVGMQFWSKVIIARKKKN